MTSSASSSWQWLLAGRGSRADAICPLHKALEPRRLCVNSGFHRGLSNFGLPAKNAGYTIQQVASDNSECSPPLTGQSVIGRSCPTFLHQGFGGLTMRAGRNASTSP